MVNPSQQKVVGNANVGAVPYLVVFKSPDEPTRCGKDVSLATKATRLPAVL